MKKIYDLLGTLLDCVKELENDFLDRKFTLDGHLLGSIGEVVANYYYGIELYNQSAKTHDGRKGDKKVQIKITQRDRVDIVDKPDFLLVLYFDSCNKAFYEVYNGTGHRAWKCTGKLSGGFHSMSIRKLNKLNNCSEYQSERIEFKEKDIKLKDFTEYLRKE